MRHQIDSIIHLNPIILHKLILFCLPAIGMMGIGVPLVLKLYDISLLGSYIAIPLILAPILFIKMNHESYKLIKLKKENFKAFSIIYFICFLFSIKLLYSFEVRPYQYYIIMTLMVLCVLFQILYFEISNLKSYLILTEIIILISNFIWGASLKYYFYVGRTDAIFHTWLVHSLVENGIITDTFGIYQPFPLWHILVSFVIMAAKINIPEHKEMFLVSGILYAFLIPTAYLIALNVFKNKKIALLSALFISINSYIIINGMYSIARSAIFYLMVLLMLLLIDKNMRMASLSILVTASMIIYHTASMPFILIIFFIVFLLEKLYKISHRNRIISVYFLLLTAVMALTYWIYFAQTLFYQLAKNIIQEGELVSGYGQYSTVTELFNYLHYTPLIFLAILGSLYLLSTDGVSDREKILCIVGLALIPISFPGPILLFEKFFADLRITRFSDYSCLFISMMGAIGYAHAFFRAKNAFRILLLILFFAMVFLTISNDFIASDNPLIKRQFYTFYLTHEEINSFNRVAEITVGYVLSDYVASRYLESSAYKTKEQLLQVDDKCQKFLRDSNNDTILIRDGELIKRPLKLFMGGSSYRFNPSWDSTFYYDKGIGLWATLIRYNKIYSSNSVSAFN